MDPEGRIRLGAEPTEEEVREVMRRARALQTPSLAIVEGSGLDHGLVWEDGSLDLGVTSLDQAVGHFVHDRLPQGDGELLLRRFVDDSVNLLTNIELNRRRADEGRPTLELLWPWGPGFRPAMPNLALLRGEPIWLASNSLRTRGLGRLSGLRLLEMHAKFEDVWECLAEDRTLIWEFEQAREWREKDLDRLDHWFRAFCQTILGALWEAREEHPVRLAILAPGLAEGLALDASTNDPAREGVRVFDERRLGDPALPLSYSWELILQITKA